MIHPAHTPEMIEGLCQYLGGLNLGLVYNPAGYAATEPGVIIVKGALPAGRRALSVRFYLEEPPEPNVDMTYISIQLRTRFGTDPLEGMALHGRIHAVLNEKAGLSLGKTRASLIMGGGLAYLGMDENGLHDYTRNFRIRSSGRVTE